MGFATKTWLLQVWEEFTQKLKRKENKSAGKCPWVTVSLLTWVPMCLIAPLKHVEEHSEGDVLSSFTNPGKNAALPADPMKWSSSVSCRVQKCYVKPDQQRED